MCVSSEKQTRDEALGKSLETMIEEGASHQSCDSKVELQEWRRKNIAGVCAGQDIAPRWGSVFETDEYRIAEVRVGNLSFGCIDFGENL